MPANPWKPAPWTDVDTGPLEGRLHPWVMPLRSPWPGRHGPIEKTHGWRLGLQARDGRTGWGEAVYPPGGGERALPLYSSLAALVEAGRGHPAAWWTRHLEALPAPARLALETALLDLAAQAAGRPLAQYLAPGAVAQVDVNAPAGGLDEGLEARLRAARAAGYRVAKVKLGRRPVAEELGRLRRLRVPEGLALRFDANRAWSPSEAERMLHALAEAHWPVEACEEPLADPEPGRLARLQSVLPFDLALDESLHDRYLALSPASLPVRRVVLKPARLGGLRRALAWAEAARAAGRTVVFTSWLEGPTGLRALVHLAAAWGRGVHGLGTAAWFAQPDPELLPRQGRLSVPQGPGLGGGGVQGRSYGK